MTNPGDNADRATASSAAPGALCPVCRGTGGGIIPCTECHGTGRLDRPASRWLSGWRYDGVIPELDGSVVGTGLTAQDEQALLAEALGPGDPAPKCYLCEGPDITRLGDLPLAHYDVTGQCRARHPHVVWDAAGANIDEITPVAQELAVTVVDPTASWAPPGNAGPGNFAALVNPALWHVMSVISVALWTAGSSGQGTRAAMEWLSSGHLAQMAAFCRPLAQRLGRGSMPLLSLTDELLAGPQEMQRASIQAAWQSLAPVEEAIRLGVQAQRLDLHAWLASSAVLAVSLPPQASMAHRQMAIAMLVAAKSVARQPGSPEPTVIWHHVDAPHPRGATSRIAAHWLVLTEEGARFASWTARAGTGGFWGPEPVWMLGSAADTAAWQAVTGRLGAAGRPALSAGQVLIARAGSAPAVLTRTVP